MALKPEFISEEELDEITGKINNEAIKNIVLAAYYTGCRLNELISLKHKHVNLKEKILTIGDADNVTKNKKQRTIPICNRLKEVLKIQMQRCKDKESYLFSKNTGYKYDGDYVSKKFKSAVRAAGLRETIHFHTLRHSFGSTLGMKGVPIITVKELMGHSSITTTQIYSHTTLHDMRRAIQTFNTGGTMQ